MTQNETLEIIQHIVTRSLGCDPWDLHSPDTGRAVSRARAICGLIAHRHAHIPQRKIGGYFGRNHRWAQQAIYRLELECFDDILVKQIVDKMVRDFQRYEVYRSDGPMFKSYRATLWPKPISPPETMKTGKLSIDQTA